MRRMAGLKDELESWIGLESSARDLGELLDLALAESDESLTLALSEEVVELGSTLEELEFRLILSGEYDDHNAILALHAGAGGVDSQDWAQMLMRMYLRWAERRGIQGRSSRRVPRRRGRDQERGHADFRVVLLRISQGRKGSAPVGQDFTLRR